MNFAFLKKMYTDHWLLLFEIGKMGSMDLPLSPQILSNPTHNVTKHLLYLYTMENFLYTALNKACREKDKSLIQYFGPYAAALSYIIYHANS